MTDRPEMFGPTKGFLGMADSMELCKMLCGRPLLPWQRNLGKKSHMNPLVWQIDRRCLHLPGGFRGWPIQWNHAKYCVADPCCHGNDVWLRCGDLVAYRLVISWVFVTVVFGWLISASWSFSCHGMAGRIIVMPSIWCTVVIGLHWPPSLCLAFFKMMS